MLSCKDINHLASQYLDKNLPLSTRLKVRMHLFMCVDCRNFMNQFKTTINAIRQTPPEPVSEATIEHQVSALLHASKDIKSTDIDK